ncbi:hypothetical protein RF11_13968 [Thelohanellus kitauei]|uniref:Uncharacterized protein n=1 Tax=Thelohanellus kitauei TaxID=669202 RepID=A0A0C2M1P7_THEKT|nr:hypothetical protein RF11_13968 [Thelohanellus kitauei]
MEESEELKSERQRICAMNRSCEDALQIIQTFQTGHPKDFTNYRTLLPVSTPTPAAVRIKIEPSRPSSNIDISEPSQQYPVKSISNMNLNASPLPKSPMKKSPDTISDQIDIKKPRRPPPKFK